MDAGSDAQRAPGPLCEQDRSALPAILSLLEADEVSLSRLYNGDGTIQMLPVITCGRPWRTPLDRTGNLASGLSSRAQALCEPGQTSGCQGPRKAVLEKLIIGRALPKDAVAEN